MMYSGHPNRQRILLWTEIFYVIAYTCPSNSPLKHIFCLYNKYLRHNRYLYENSKQIKKKQHLYHPHTKYIQVHKHIAIYVSIFRKIASLRHCHHFLLYGCTTQLVLYRSELQIIYLGLKYVCKRELFYSTSCLGRLRTCVVALLLLLELELVSCFDTHNKFHFL